MKYLTLDYIKAHSRIDGDMEDSVLELYGSAAEDTVMTYLNRGATTDEAIDSLLEKYGEIPTPVIQATLMLVDVSYQYRSPLSPSNISIVPYTFDLLVKPYMIL